MSFLISPLPITGKDHPIIQVFIVLPILSFSIELKLQKTMIPPKDTSIGKGYYKLDIYSFSPDLRILKTLHIRKDTIFLQVKQDLLDTLDGDEFYNIDQLNSFYELGVCFDWDGKNYDKMTFPDEFASVVTTISQMEFNSFGKIRIIFIDTRQYWRMKYLKEDINEWRVWKPIDSVGSSVLFEPPSQMTIQEHLQMELSNIATFQGKLQRKYELNKKQEVWRYLIDFCFFPHSSILLTHSSIGMYGVC